MAELLRFATAGSVDDGKSTLIGRLLYDSKAIFEDQLEAVERTSRAAGRRVHQPGAAHRRPAGRARAGHHDRRRLPLLRHAPAQVHHRRHPRPHPVHAQHGHGRLDRRPRADPRRRPQGHRRADRAATRSSRRCCGVPHLVLCVNKMDLVDWSTRSASSEIKAEFRSFATEARRRTTCTFIPMSALHGDNVVDRSANMPWYEGSSLLHHLEEVHIASDRNLIDCRFPVQYVIRPRSRPSDPRLPRLRGPGRGRRAQAGRRGRRAAVGLHVARSRRSTRPTARSTRPSRRCRSRSAWPTTSTSAAAT